MAPEGPRAAVAAGLALCAVAALAAAVRLAGIESVLLQDGTVVFPNGDALYHARLTLAAWIDLPHALRFDPYLGYPRGAPVPWPPLFDLALAAVARLTGGGEAGVERVLALSGPAFGALGALAVYAAARQVGGAGLALGAAALYALLPVSADAGRVGNCDHHAAVSALGAALLALCLAAVAGTGAERSRPALASGLALARTAILFTWPGSLLYFALLDATLLLAFVATGRRELLRLELASALLPAALAAPWLAAGPTPFGGPLSSIALSWLHVLWCTGAAAVAAALLLLERARPSDTFLRRGVRVGVATAAAGAAALVLPGVLPGLELAARFLTLEDATGFMTLELAPLYPLGGRAPLAPPGVFFAGFAWLVPLAPLAAAWAAWDPRRRGPALVLTGWTALLAALTVTQVRYANELAAPIAVAFALGLAAAGGLVAAPLRRRAPAAAGALAAAAATLGGALLLLPALRADAGALAQAVAAGGRPGGAPGADPALATAHGTLMRFGRLVRETTPETAGFFADDGRPEYGVLSTPNVGHALRYYARRPVTVDSFFAYLSPERFRRVQEFFVASHEDGAIAIARELGARYAVAWAEPRSAPASLLGRLSVDDGRATAAGPRLERFRLVAEAPARGRPLGDLLGVATPRGVVPYKLFEIVSGAALETAAPPGTPVSARIVVRSPSGRVFGYVAETTAGDDGVARLVVPYATRTRAPVRPDGDWRVRVGEREVSVAVTDEDVTGGRTVRIGGGGEGGPRAE